MTITDLAIRPVFMAAAILLGIGGGGASADEIKSNDAALSRSAFESFIDCICRRS